MQTGVMIMWQTYWPGRRRVTRR